VNKDLALVDFPLAAKILNDQAKKNEEPKSETRNLQQ
jgi:hypothetical protein